MCPVANVSKGQWSKAIKGRVDGLNRKIVPLPQNITNHFKTLG